MCSNAPNSVEHWWPLMQFKFYAYCGSALSNPSSLQGFHLNNLKQAIQINIERLRKPTGGRQTSWPIYKRGQLQLAARPRPEPWASALHVLRSTTPLRQCRERLHVPRHSSHNNWNHAQVTTYRRRLKLLLEPIRLKLFFVFDIPQATT